MLFHIIANVADIDDILHRRWNEPYAKGADKVQEFLGKKPRKADDPDELVSDGATIQERCFRVIRKI
jgi:hypothetical protein